MDYRHYTDMHLLLHTLYPVCPPDIPVERYDPLCHGYQITNTGRGQDRPGAGPGGYKPGDTVDQVWFHGGENI